MKISPLTSGPPQIASGVGRRPEPQIAGLDRFFALIQSFFQARSEPPPVRDPQTALRRDAHDSRFAPSGPVRQGRREAADDPQSPGDVSDDLRRADPGERRQEKIAPSDGPAARTEGEGGSDSAGKFPKLAEALKEVTARLRTLAETIDEGMTFNAAFGELLKILALLQELASQVPQSELHAFFKDLGPEFETLVGEVLQLFEAVDQGGLAHPDSVMRPGRLKQMREEKLATVQELAQSLARILEGAGTPRARPAAPEALEEAILPDFQAGVQEEEEPELRGPAAPRTAQGSRSEEIVGKPVSAALQASSAPAAQVDSPIEAAAPSPQVTLAASAAAAAASAASEGVEPIRSEGAPRFEAGPRLSESSAKLLAKDPIRLTQPQIETVERIIRMAQMSEGNGGRTLRIRLQPPILGPMRMDLAVRDGVLAGSFQVETPAARAAVLSQVEQLKNALADQGVEISGFQVSVEGQEKNPGALAEERREAARQGNFANDRADTGESKLAGAAAGEPSKTSYMDVRG